MRSKLGTATSQIILCKRSRVPRAVEGDTPHQYSILLTFLIIEPCKSESDFNPELLEDFRNKGLFYLSKVLCGFFLLLLWSDTMFSLTRGVVKKINV